MKHLKDFTFQDLMQLSHDLKEMQKDFDMIQQFLEPDQIRTVLKK